MPRVQHCRIKHFLARGCVLVWSLDYKPLDSNERIAGLPERSGPLILEDQTQDGGAFIFSNHQLSGRRLVAESIPKAIYWLSDCEIQDYEKFFISTVSDRLRALIENIEPDTHQFTPVRIINAVGETLEDRWHFQVCNRLDCVDHERSTGWLDRVIYRPQKGVPWHLVYREQQIGDAKFWCDKHIATGRMVTRDARAKLLDSGMTGFEFSEYDSI